MIVTVSHQHPSPHIVVNFFLLIRFFKIYSLNDFQIYTACSVVVSDSSASPWTVGCQAPPSMGFPRKNTRAGCHALLQRIFPTQGSNTSPALAGILYHWAAGKPKYTTSTTNYSHMLFITPPELTYFDHFHPCHPLPTLISGNHQSVLCIHKFTSWFWCFGFPFFFLRSHVQVS